LTRLSSHHPHLTHPLQSLDEQAWDQGRLCVRYRPHGDEYHQPRVHRRPRVFAFVSATVDTRLLSHCPPRSQSLQQPHRRQGCYCTRCHPQQDEDHKPEVRRRSREFAFLSAPVDTSLFYLSLSRLPLRCPSLAVSRATTSETRMPQQKNKKRSKLPSGRRSSRGWPGCPSTCSWA